MDSWTERWRSPPVPFLVNHFDPSPSRPCRQKRPPSCSEFPQAYFSWQRFEQTPMLFYPSLKAQVWFGEQDGRADTLRGRLFLLRNLAVGPLPMGSHFRGFRSTAHFRTYFSGDWDVHWGNGALTHGHLFPPGGGVKTLYPCLGELQNRWQMLMAICFRRGRGGQKRADLSCWVSSLTN